MTLERIVYVGSDSEYASAIGDRVPDGVTFDSFEAVADAEARLEGATVSVVVVDTTALGDAVGAVQAIDDACGARIVAVVEGSTEPLVVFDLLAAGAAEYAERDSLSGRPKQLIDTLAASDGDPQDSPAAQFRAELEARRNVEKRLTTVLDRIPHPVFYRDREGVYLGCNAAFEEFCGHPREEIIGNRTVELQGEHHAEVCERHDETVLETGETQVLETTVTTEGEERHVRVQKAPLSESVVGFDGVVASIEDITAQRRQRERLEEQTENLEILNGVTRHDIRNDLQVVLGMAEVLRDHVDEAGEEYLERMVAKGQHAVDITRQARDLTETMLDSGGATDRIPLKSTLETQIDEIRGTYDAAILTVEGEIPSCSVVADGMLSSVFRNVLANGIQHNDSSVPRLRVWAQADESQVTVHIADNGPGVPDDRKAEIFGRGEKGLESSGTGLGLYLVDTLMERYGGEISVTDGDEGAEFVITLQRATESDRARADGGSTAQE